MGRQYLMETDCKKMCWIEVIQDHVQWQALSLTVLNHQVLQYIIYMTMLRNSYLASSDGSFHCCEVCVIGSDLIF